MEMESSGGVLLTLKRAEIDTTAPFRSVREAVSMFGDTLLGGHPYVNKVNQSQMGINDETIDENDDASKLGRDINIEAELEETKHSLQKAREESSVMENRLCSLREELERTKRELQLLKQNEPQKQPMDDDDDQLDEIESVEIVEDSAKLERKAMQITSTDEEEGEGRNNINVKFENKRYVRFRNAAPSAHQEMFVPHGVDKLQRHPSLRKKKKKGLIPLIGTFFSKKRASHEVA